MNAPSANPGETPVEESALLAYLYQSPVRIIVTDLAGRVELMTPVAAQMLMPLAPGGRLDNLFEILHAWLPQLPGMVASGDRTVLVEGLQFGVPWGRQQRTLSFSLYRVASDKLFATLMDVTAEVEVRERERAAADQALAERTAQVQQVTQEMSTMLDVLPSMVACWNAELSARFLNSAYARRWGLTREAAAGQTLPALVGPENFATLRPRVEAVLRGEPQTFEFPPVADSAGRQRFLTSYLIPDLQSGRVRGFYEIVQDVTASRQARQAVEASEALMRRIGRLAQVGGWTLDLRTGAFNWSETLRSLLETADDFEPTLAATLAFHRGEDHQRISQAVRAAMDRGQGWDLELPLTTGRGRSIWVRSVGEVDHEEDRPVRLVGALQDISERKATELELQAHRHHLQELVAVRTAELERAEFLNEQALDLARAGPWRIDFAEGEHHYISSPRTVEIFGDPPRPDFRYHLLDDWQVNIAAVDPALAATTLDAIRAVLTGGRTRYDAVYPYRRPADGRLIWIHALGQVALDAAGRPAHLYGVAMDVTAARRAEDALREAKDAADVANRAKSEFLANMSHEIRTPLNAISGMAHLIRMDPLSPRQSDRLDKLEMAKDHLLRTLDNILDLSKIEAGKFQLEDSDVHIDAVVDSVLHMLADRARAKHLALSGHADPMPAPLRGDQTRLVQALLNLAANAVKFTETGSVIIRASQEAVHAEHLTVRFEVRDTGIGIEREALERLFQSFEQVDSSTSRKYGGSGLGLAITRRIAELMGGEVGVRSEPGQGSVFWFTARLQRQAAPPIDEATASDADVEHALRARFSGRRALLVEDDPLNQEIACILLEEAGLLVELAHDGVEAVERASRQRYDFILMDLQMPRMDGLEATRRIRALEHGWQVPIVALTGNAFADDRRRCLAAGMDDFLTKPIEPALLYRTVLRELTRRD